MVSELLSNKLHHDLDTFKGEPEKINWYIGTYLSLPRVFMSIVRRKILPAPKVNALLIPTYTVKDPVTNRGIAINITDRYFFIGSNEDIKSEEDIGVAQHINTIMLLRNSDKYYTPSKITPSDIRNVIRMHLQQRRLTIQQDVTIQVTDGTFKDWYGTVETTTHDKESIKVRFFVDEFGISTEMPSVLCKVAS